MPAVNFLLIIDVLGTAAFAVSGASMAIQRKLDVFGIIVIAFVTAVGGGTLRDVLIGRLPVAWLENEVAIAVILISAIGTMVYEGLVKQFPVTLFLFDSLGLGLFTIVGIQKGLDAGFSPGIAVTLGTITASFGGVIRDVLLNQVPLIFRKEIYASACIAGGVVYFLLSGAGLSEKPAQLCCLITIVLIRILAVKFQLSMPQISGSKKMES